MKRVVLLIVLMCSFGNMLRAQSCGDTPNDVKLKWMTDQIAEIHNRVMTGATIEGVQKEMNIPLTILLEDVSLESGRRLLRYDKLSDISSVECYFCFGGNNRVEFAGVVIAGTYNEIDDVLRKNDFYLDEMLDKQIACYKNKYSKVQADVIRAQGQGIQYSVNMRGPEGFQYITSEQYVFLKRREAIDEVMLQANTKGVEMSTALKDSISRQIGKMLYEFCCANKVRSAELHFDDYIVISKSGEMIPQMSPIKFKNGDLEFKNGAYWIKNGAYWTNESYIGNGEVLADMIGRIVSSMSFAPQHITVLDTSFVAKVYGIVPVQYEFANAEFCVLLHDGYLEYKESSKQNKSMYAAHYTYLNQYLNELNYGKGEYRINLKVSRIDKEYEYDCKILKFKPFSKNKKDVQLPQGDKIPPKFSQCKFSDWLNRELNDSHIFRVYAEENWARNNKDRNAAEVIFTVSERGEVCNVKMQGVADGTLQKEILRIFLTSPQWTPGYMGKTKVPVTYSIPIYY